MKIDAVGYTWFIFIFLLFGCEGYEEQEAFPESLVGNWYSERNGQLIFSLDEDIAFVSDEFIHGSVLYMASENNYRLEGAGKKYEFRLADDQLIFGDLTLVKKFDPAHLKDAQIKRPFRAGYATVRGYIRDFNPAFMYSPIKVAVMDDILVRENEYLYGYDSTGYFEFSVPLNHVQNILIRFTSEVSFKKLLLAPDDTLDIFISDIESLNADFEGSLALSNYNIWAFDSVWNEAYDRPGLNKLYTLLPDRFFPGMESRMSRLDSISDAYCALNPCGQYFETWVASDIQVQELRNIYLYRQQSIHSMDSAVIREWKEGLPVVRPDSTYRWSNYFSRLVWTVSNSTVNPEQFSDKLQRGIYSYLLESEAVRLTSRERSLMLKLYHSPGAKSTLSDSERAVWYELEDKYSNELKEVEEKSSYAIEVDGIAQSPSREMHEYAMTELYYRAVFKGDNRRISEYLYSLMDSLIESPDVRAKFDSLHYLAGLDEPDYSLAENMFTVEGTSGKLLQEIRRKHPGQEILIDVWATWCAPCIQEFRAFEENYPQMNDRVYAFICVDSHPDQWAAMINKHEVPGTHYLANTRQWEELKERWKVAAIPFKALIDKEGKMRRDEIK